MKSKLKISIRHSSFANPTQERGIHAASTSPGKDALKRPEGRAPCLGRAIRHSALVIALLCALCVSVATSKAQLTGTYSTNCLPAPITLLTTSSNLLSTQYTTNRIWQGRNIGIGMSFVGGSATNTGTIAFQFGIVANGANALKSTTRPFTIVSTANGTTPVIDWAVLPNYTLGPADSIVLLGITNSLANVNPVAAGSVTVNSVWIQTDTRP